MSASPVARQATQCQSIPSRKIVINDSSQLPNDYSTTPGGTLYSTTPGGTRIVYERNFLLNLRNSPIARTPPKNLPVIPGVTVPGNSPSKTLAAPVPSQPSPKENGDIPASPNKNKPAEPTEEPQEPQFQMEI